MSVYLGIDQSLQCTGVFWHGEGILGWSEIKPKDLRGARRLIYIKTKLLSILQEQRPTLVVIEGFSYNSNGKSFELGEVAGMIKVLLEELEIPHIVASPTQVKKFITGRGGAEKIDVVNAINKKLNFKWTIKHNNLADAAALSYIASSYESTDSTMRHELEVIHALKNSTFAKAPATRTPRPKSKFLNF